MDKVWMKPPKGAGGEPQQVEATPEILTPLMVKGWSQCEPPESPPFGKLRTVVSEVEPPPKKHRELVLSEVEGEVNDHAS